MTYQWTTIFETFNDEGEANVGPMSLPFSGNFFNKDSSKCCTDDNPCNVQHFFTLPATKISVEVFYFIRDGKKIGKFVDANKLISFIKKVLVTKIGVSASDIEEKNILKTTRVFRKFLGTDTASFIEKYVSILRENPVPYKGWEKDTYISLESISVPQITYHDSTLPIEKLGRCSCGKIPILRVFYSCRTVGKTVRKQSAFCSLVCYEKMNANCSKKLCFEHSNNMFALAKIEGTDSFVVCCSQQCGQDIRENWIKDHHK